jgi:hypothetical protein
MLLENPHPELSYRSALSKKMHIYLQLHTIVRLYESDTARETHHQANQGE